MSSSAKGAQQMKITRESRTGDVPTFYRLLTASRGDRRAMVIGDCEPYLKTLKDFSQERMLESIPTSVFVDIQ
ncbi:hypothetical protein Hypma_010635 [Hypsizygus marmoreus]|uniref:Uncharacterized protein n=1 Tax=Hypsizygus marmoreus TaxID=39966 RepID=A0A369JS52_HYPMA|nr:hypothetical protein Hypma_010635 [Hypsizygus marmoreus]